MTAQTIKMYSEKEYLELEREADYKSEYYRGEIFAMAGAGHNHNRIVENLSIEIGTFLKGKTCRTFSRDMRLHIPVNGLYTYPDLLVICGQNQFLDDKDDTIVNPTAIFEVLSPSTSGYDRGAKFHFYRSIETLKDFVMIDSLAVAAEVYSKAPNGMWQLMSEAYDLDGAIEIPSLGLSLAMKDIFAQTNNLKSIN
ncbi:Uma2 family endonuclease [Dyadobacter arcticus]|uniref:Uma2 family endonuclease n=1 Tax=Dyadobacter arcticus TaxID=1078754 RepID=A0ABX0UFG1_9BACT|nr:Uma2 family endonuclease [Dyadobacter arcticus]NIJ51739.1 Uma2 family endonuclease [Dyadobacter arcticus]